MDLVTTVLELVALVLLVAAAAVGAGQAAGLPAGLGVAGGGLLVVSWVLQGCPLPARMTKGAGQ